MSEGYEVAHVDELEELPINRGEFVWRPVRRRFGISAFGTNAYTARAGQRVVEEHTERDGHEELYVVLRGRATFALGDDEVDAPAGTLVFVRPGTRRGAIAAMVSRVSRGIMGTRSNPVVGKEAPERAAGVR